MLELITSFLAKVASRLSGIARSTKSGLNGKDLHGDVWIAASDIGAKRGRPVDLQDPTDQELVLSRVYSQTRRQRDWRLHFAESLDAEVADGMRLSEQIGEVVSMDPIAVLTRRASMIDEAGKLAHSYSQAAAYVTALRNFDGDRPRLSAHLAVSVRALGNRMERAFQVVERQNSILDGHDVIEDNFLPLACQFRAPVPGAHVTMDQAELQF